MLSENYHNIILKHKRIFLLISIRQDHFAFDDALSDNFYYIIY